jgi:hypothetical protein
MLTEPDRKVNFSLEVLTGFQMPHDLCISPDATKIVYSLRRKISLGLENLPREVCYGTFYTRC